MTLRAIYIIPFFGALVIAGCNVLDSDHYIDHDEFDSIFTVLLPDTNLNLYRSSKYVGVKFTESVTPEIAEMLASEYSLTPVTMFHHFPVSGYWEGRLSKSIIIMKIPEGAKPDDYLSNYPRRWVRGFGDRPEVQFCLPTFAFNTSGAPESRLYIYDIVVAYSEFGLTRIYPHIKKYNLELVQIDDYDWMENIFYTFRVTSKSPGNPLEIANELSRTKIFIWAVADMWQSMAPRP